MGMLPGTLESYWMDSTRETSYPALEEDLSVDVAVIGGGIAGVCTAWELSRAGASVVLLEADRIVAGTSGYTTAKLSSLHGDASSAALAHGRRPPSDTHVGRGIVTATGLSA